jgi:hypothetical protein
MHIVFAKARHVHSPGIMGTSCGSDEHFSGILIAYLVLMKVRVREVAESDEYITDNRYNNANDETMMQTWIPKMR